MCDGVVIDTNVIVEYRKEYFYEEGEILNLVENIMNSCGIVITNKIESEWEKTCFDQLFREWFTVNVMNEKIQYVNPHIDQEIMKKIHNKYGLPKKGCDGELIKAANVTMLKYILTNDMDLFDPKKKKAMRKEKERIMRNRNGNLCKYLKKNLGIIVGSPEHCNNDLECYFN